MAKPRRFIEIEHRTLYQGFFRLDLRRFQHERFDGEMSEVLCRELFERGNAVAVLPYDPTLDAVVLIRQFLLGAHYAGLDDHPLQIIAGMVGEGESEEDVARRESVEEANLVVTDLRRVTRYLPSPGGSTEVVTVFCALIDSGGAGGVYGLAQEGENIRVEVLPAQDAIDRMDRGEITPSSAVIALAWLARHREALRAGK